MTEVSVSLDTLCYDDYRKEFSGVKAEMGEVLQPLTVCVYTYAHVQRLERKHWQCNANLASFPGCVGPGNEANCKP